MDDKKLVVRVMFSSLFFLCAVSGIIKAHFFHNELAVPVKSSYHFMVYNYSHDIHIRLCFVFYWF